MFSFPYVLLHFFPLFFITSNSQLAYFVHDKREKAASERQAPEGSSERRINRISQR